MLPAHLLKPGKCEPRARQPLPFSGVLRASNPRPWGLGPRRPGLEAGLRAFVPSCLPAVARPLLQPLALLPLGSPDLGQGQNFSAQ